MDKIKLFKGLSVAGGIMGVVSTLIVFVTGDVIRREETKDIIKELNSEKK